MRRILILVLFCLFTRIAHADPRESDGVQLFQSAGIAYIVMVITSLFMAVVLHRMRAHQRAFSWIITLFPLLIAFTLFVSCEAATRSEWLRENGSDILAAGIALQSVVVFLGIPAALIVNLLIVIDVALSGKRG